MRSIKSEGRGSIIKVYVFPKLYEAAYTRGTCFGFQIDNLFIFYNLVGNLKKENKFVLIKKMLLTQQLEKLITKH